MDTVSHLSEELQRQISATSASIDAVSEETKIARSQIYKWLRSEQTSISAVQLDKISGALSTNPIDHAKLLVAHLQDERVGSARDLVRIEMDTIAELRDRPRARTKGEKAIQFLAEQRLQSRDVNDLVIDLARVLGADLDDARASYAKKEEKGSVRKVREILEKSAPPADSPQK